MIQWVQGLLLISLEQQSSKSSHRADSYSMGVYRACADNLSIVCLHCQQSQPHLKHGQKHVSNISTPFSIFDYAVKRMKSIFIFLNSPVYKWRGTSRRGWSWALSRARRCPKPKRTDASCPPVKTFCPAACRGCLPPWDPSAASAAPTPRPSRRRCGWSGHRNLRSPTWSHPAGCSLSSPSPERTPGVPVRLPPPSHSAAPSSVCPGPRLLSSPVGGSIIR